MAAIISDVLRTPVHYQQISGEAFKDQLTGHGMSEAMAQAQLDLTIAKDNGLDEGITRTPKHATDAPTTFWRWCEETLKRAALAA